jgi:hypothetical protein
VADRWQLSLMPEELGGDIAGDVRGAREEYDEGGEYGEGGNHGESAKHGRDVSRKPNGDISVRHNGECELGSTWPSKTAGVVSVGSTRH